MNYISKSIILLSLLLCISCSDDEPEIINPDNQIPEEPTLEFNDDDISFNVANLKWQAVIGSSNETIVYDIYLGDTKIKENNKDIDYTLTKLVADTEYSGRIVPKALPKSTKEKVTYKLSPILFSFKTKQFSNPDAPTPEISNFSVTNITTVAATLNWDTATISDGSQISYNIYIDGDIVTSNLSETSFTFDNLEANSTYKGILLAISTNQKSVAVDFEFTTQPESDEIPLASFTFYRGATISYPASNWIQLIPIFSPVNANTVDLNWTSSDESIAVVDKSGYVNTKKVGVTIITATFVDNPNVTQSIELTVTNRRPTDDKFISAQPKRSSLLIGDSKTIQVNKFNIEGGSSDDSFVFSSSDASIASVDNNGNVTGLKEGTVAITVTSTIDETITASVMLRVVSTPIPVTSIFIWGETDRTVYFQPGVGRGGGVGAEPEDATDKTLIWTSTNTNVVSVSAFGSIRTEGTGSASIIVTSASNTSISKTINYTVLADPTSYNETTGVYTAPANSRVSLNIIGFAEIDPSSNQDFITIEPNFSVKDKNGQQLLTPNQQEGAVVSYTVDNSDPLTPAFIDFYVGFVDFDMPSDEEVTIEVSLRVYDSNIVFISSAELDISNTISSQVRKSVRLRDDQIILE